MTQKNSIGRKLGKKKKSFEHSPTLNTVLMVEDTLKQAGEVIKIPEIKRRLPKKIMHQTLITILEYLQYSGKIIISPKGVLWVYSPREDLTKMMEGGLEI
ncbi:MAG: hypothetical protein ACOC1P_05805 [Minisyncoccales bacterium]